jgi:hypothetical protein
MTQLRGLPVLVPKKEEQRKYLRAISVIRAQKSALVGQSVEISDLFTSLQSRAFSGKL